MRRLTTLSPNALSGRFARQALLLLVLAVGLGGFFLLLDLLSSLVSSGPEDILAVRPSEEGISLPNGVGLIGFSVVAVSVILGIVALTSTQRWPLRLSNIRFSLPLAGGALVAVALVAVGFYLAFSGTLGRDVPYEQHLVDRSVVNPVTLAVIAGVFLLFAISGILAPRLVVPLLLYLIVVVVVIGLVSVLRWEGAKISQGGEIGIALVVLLALFLALNTVRVLDPRVLLPLCALAAITIGIWSLLPWGSGPELAYEAAGTGAGWGQGGWAGGAGSDGFRTSLVWLLRVFWVGFGILAVILGFLMPRLLVPILLVWLLLTSIGLVDALASRSLELACPQATSGSASFGEPPSDPEDREKYLQVLEEAGAHVHRLENGGALLSQPTGARLYAGTTTSQSTKPISEPVFQVTGAANTAYLRTCVGDLYEQGRWAQLDPIGLPYSAEGSIGELVGQQHASTTGDFAALPDWSRDAALLSITPGNPTSMTTDNIQILPSDTLSEFPAGPLPSSLSLMGTSLDGDFRPFSATFTARDSVTDYSWTSKVASYSEDQYSAAVPSSDPTYTQLPANVPERIQRLALDVTARHTTPYAKAKALEQHLNTEYTYAYAATVGRGQPPPGRDPADWFLFERLEGTSGSFSTAFVVLARSIGIPARVVSGWVIDPTAGTQGVSTDQAHQWAEVPFRDIGWVRFDPLSEAERQDIEDGGPGAGGNGGFLPAASSSGRAGSGEGNGDLEKAFEELEQAGARVERLENGSALVGQNTGSLVGEAEVGQSTGSLVASTPTTRQSTQTTAGIGILEVTGAAHTSYLRTSVGDVYEGGRWQQSDPVTVHHAGAGTLSDSVRDRYADATSELAALPIWRRDTALLFGLSDNPTAIDRDTILVRPAGRVSGLSPGPVPISLPLTETPLRGTFRPFSATFSTSEAVTSYSWTSNVLSYSEAQYSAAVPSSDPTYTQLPSDLPARVRRLALQVTEGHDTPYAKAEALEQHLKTQYIYAFADSWEEGHPPPGHDPADWFLFERREGTCGAFSTAFVVLARSIGIPARVVSGWVVTPTGESQTVYSDQAHQWAEVPFEGIGWVRFEPTAPGGAPSRLAVATEAQSQEEPASAPPIDRLDTVTTITQWPPRMSRQAPFSVGGTVHTIDGQPVDEMTVEVYINETKQHGGTKLGTTETRSGAFQAEVQIPATLKLGAYQLLARAVFNDRFKESWSDPDLTVFSRSGLQLSGPSQVPVGVDAIFHGRLSDDNDAGATNRELAVTVDGAPTEQVVTGPAGNFSFTKSFSEPGPHWVEVRLVGDDSLLDNSVHLDFEVIVPTETTVLAPLLVEVGKEFQVTGVLRHANGEPISGKRLTIQVGNRPEQSALTDDSGSFELTTLVEEAGEFVLRAEFAGDAPVHSSDATARLGARHAVALSIDLPDESNKGSGQTFNGRVTSQTLSPIGQMELSVEDAGGNQLTAVATAEDGSFALTPPNAELLQAGPLAIRYSGDDLNMPVSYFLNVPVTEAGFNWLLWAGVPMVTLAVVFGGLGGYRFLLGRGLLAGRLPVSFLRRVPTKDLEESEAAEFEAEGTEEELVDLHLAQLEIRFPQQEPDLPDVWEIGEEVGVAVHLADSEGQAIVAARVEVAVAEGGPASPLVTDDAGVCVLQWTAEALGEYVVSALARQAGGGGASATRSLRVVDFREEIVRLYNDFLIWAAERTPDITEQSTPREVELIVVSTGLQLDQRSLDELISRFEEADYSEHPIARRQYEAMYRAWHTIVSDRT